MQTLLCKRSRLSTTRVCEWRKADRERFKAAQQTDHKIPEAMRNKDRELFNATRA